MADKRKYKGRRFINFQPHACPAETLAECDEVNARELLEGYQQSVYGPEKSLDSRLWIGQRPIGDWLSVAQAERNAQQNAVETRYNDLRAAAVDYFALESLPAERGEAYAVLTRHMKNGTIKA